MSHLKNYILIFQTVFLSKLFSLRNKPIEMFSELVFRLENDSVTFMSYGRLLSHKVLWVGQQSLDRLQRRILGLNELKGQQLLLTHIYFYNTSSFDNANWGLGFRV